VISDSERHFTSAQFENTRGQT